MATVFTGEYHKLIVENVIDSVAYGICITAIINVARLTLFPSRNIKPESLPSRKERLVIFAHAFLLAVLASLFFLPFVIDRAHATGSYYYLSVDGSREQIKESIRRLKNVRLWEPRRSFWVRSTWIPFVVNEAMAATLLGCLVYQIYDNKYVLVSTLALLVMHLMGSPLVFETAILSLAVLYLISAKTSFKTPFGLGHEKLVVEEEAPSAVLVMVVSSIFALSAYINAILHYTGVNARSEVKFTKSLMFVGAFAVQAIIFTHWTEGGPICTKKVVGSIVLPEDSRSGPVGAEASEAGVNPVSHASSNESWERVDDAK